MENSIIAKVLGGLFPSLDAAMTEAVRLLLEKLEQSPGAGEWRNTRPGRGIAGCGEAASSFSCVRDWKGAVGRPCQGPKRSGARESPTGLARNARNTGNAETRKRGRSCVRLLYRISLGRPSESRWRAVGQLIPGERYGGGPTGLRRVQIPEISAIISSRWDKKIESTAGLSPLVGHSQAWFRSRTNSAGHASRGLSG